MLRKAGIHNRCCKTSVNQLLSTALPPSTNQSWLRFSHFFLLNVGLELQFSLLVIMRIIMPFCFFGSIYAFIVYLFPFIVFLQGVTAISEVCVLKKKSMNWKESEVRSQEEISFSLPKLELISSPWWQKMESGHTWEGTHNWISCRSCLQNGHLFPKCP